jgi:hypothetical protein
MGNLKTGTYVYLNGNQYLFLGYSDYKRKWLVIADTHGNKLTIHESDIYTIK